MTQSLSGNSQTAKWNPPAGSPRPRDAGQESCENEQTPFELDVPRRLQHPTEKLPSSHFVGAANLNL